MKLATYNSCELSLETSFKQPPKIQTFSSTPSALSSHYPSSSSARQGSREWLKTHRPRISLPTKDDNNTTTNNESNNNNNLLSSVDTVNTPSPSSSPPPPDPLLTKRAHMINEIIFTEKSYLDNLEGTLRNFGEKLSPILSENDYQLFFGLFPSFIEIHKSLLSSLYKRIEEEGVGGGGKGGKGGKGAEKDVRICDIILDWLPSLQVFYSLSPSLYSLSLPFNPSQPSLTLLPLLQIYGNFAANINLCSAKISKLNKGGGEFAKVVKGCRVGGGAYKGIEGMRSLTTGIPMQRLMRFE